MTSTLRACLAELLFSERPRPLADDLWPKLFHLAESWSVVPQTAAAVRSQNLDTPTEGWPEFKRVCFSTQARSAMRASKGLEALRHLHAASIPALAFKGLASMASLYANPVDRTIADADILVNLEQVPAALAILGELGFQPAAGQEFAKMQNFLDRSPGLAGNKAISLYGPAHAEVDLHWSVGLPGVPLKSMLARSGKATLFGSEIHVPAAVDAMVLTARHSLRENFTVDKMCRDLLDIRLRCNQLAGKGELAGALDFIHRSGNATALSAMAQILARYEGNPGAVEATTCLNRIESGKQRRAAGELVQVFFRQLHSGPFRKDLLYLAHSKPARQIFAGVATNWREYRGVMRSMEERTEGEEIPLAKRMGALARAATNLSLGQFRSLRALARLKYNN